MSAANNKITRSMSVSMGMNKSPGRKYGLSTEVHQESGGYKGAKGAHNPTPSDKAQENAYPRKHGHFGDPVANRAKINVGEGQWSHRRNR